MSVIVFGSINIDLVARAAVIPSPGETVRGTAFSTVPGGKGANQAVAVAKLGIPTIMAGRTGNDTYGSQALKCMTEAGVNIDNVIIDATTQTGVALIIVDEMGENSITIIPGANGTISAGDIERLEVILPGASYLLLQLEFDIPFVVAAAEAARAYKVSVVLDPAPALAEIPASLFQLTEILTPNESEAAMITGMTVCDVETAFRAARKIRSYGPEHVVVKIGSQGLVYAGPREELYVPAYQVHAVDTVAAGDAFVGGLVSGLVQKSAIRSALKLGTAAAAIAVTRHGAQQAMPTRQEVEEFMKLHS